MDLRAGAELRRQARKFFAGVLEQLIALARHERKLAQPQKDGQTYRTHLEVAARYGKPAAVAELKGPGVPPAGAYLWTWFCELSVTRSWRGEHGLFPEPLRFAEMSAWAALTGRAPRSWEIEWLRLIDAAWLTGDQREPRP